MGRAPKAKVDEIKALHQQGFTKTEIAEKVAVSRGTVSKYVRRVEGGSPSPPSPELETLFKAFYELLADLNIYAYLDQESIAEISDDRALKLTKTIVGVNKELAKRVFSPYVSYLKSVDILNLAVPNDRLDNGDLRLRKEWLALLKSHCPEKLAELM